MSVQEGPSVMCSENVTIMDPVYRQVFFDMADIFTGYHPWLMSAIGSFVVGLSGIFPLLVIPIDEGANLKTGEAYVKCSDRALQFHRLSFTALLSFWTYLVCYWNLL